MSFVATFTWHFFFDRPYIARLISLVGGQIDFLNLILNFSVSSFWLGKSKQTINVFNMIWTISFTYFLV